MRGNRSGDDPSAGACSRDVRIDVLGQHLDERSQIAKPILRQLTQTPIDHVDDVGRRVRYELA